MQKDSGKIIRRKVGNLFFCVFPPSGVSLSKDNLGLSGKILYALNATREWKITRDGYLQPNLTNVFVSVSIQMHLISE